MANSSFLEAEIWTVARTDKGNAVLVKPLGSEQAVPIFIGQLEAQSILIGLGNVPMPRPLTHDLVIQMLEKFGVTMERVEITDLRDGTFYGRILMKQGIKKISIDSRPSDALGLAARLHCPVFIAESVVEEAGIAVNMIQTEDDQTVSPFGESEDEIESDTEKERLLTELQQAVEAENYEEAARLRDKINELS
ncbi:MAG: bifunctional nuclease family protein [Spirochaeta sp.]|nr:bifunctional nuclease family protein [Spirochaeta sp.]